MSLQDTPARSIPVEVPSRDRRAYPWEFLGQVFDQLRKSSWPSLRTVVVSSALVAAVVVVVTLMVLGADALFLTGMVSLREWTSTVVLPDPVRYGLLAVQLLALAATIYTTLKGPSPSGGLASVFGGGVSESSTGRTRKDQRLFYQTLVAGTVFVVATLLVGAFF